MPEAVDSGSTTPKPKTQAETLAASRARQNKEAKSLASKLGLEARATSSHRGFAQLFATTTGRIRSSYPSDLLQREHYYVRFEAVERRQSSRKNPPTKKGLYSVNLPMPAEIATAYAQNYTNVESMLGAVSTDGGNLGEMAATAGAKMIKDKVAGASAGQALGLKMGVAINPHMAVLFQGTEFRSHSFSYKLTALSQQDARNINQIVSSFKYFSSPILTDVSYTFPDEWFITFMGGQGPLPTLFKMGRSVLKNVGVKYGTESSATFTRDDSPLTVDLTLEFQETELVTKDQIAEGY
tara:strand:- start:8751 stop:9638 length:888 start_codon:yes stop_codon:yes gene_type:complete